MDVPTGRTLYHFAGWVTHRYVKDAESGLNGDTMGISDLFSASDVLLDLNAANKRHLLEVLSGEAGSRLARSGEEILDALAAREQLGSTALRDGVALPHAQLPGTFRPLMLFARLRRPIYFDETDDQPVDLVFLMLWPAEAAKGFLSAMGDVCRALREPNVLRRLRSAGTPEEVVQLLQQAQGSSEGASPVREEE